ncbi:MAG: substrate-binding domain-containing protein [Butyricicoccaceae bacterium]
MKTKMIQACALAAVAAMALTACGGGSSASSAESGDSGSSSAPITVVSREDGSGTRGAFTELMGILVEDGDTKTDNTTTSATIANKTEVVIQNVAGDPNAIGYISLGSLKDNVKAVKVDGVEATAENVLSGEYKVSRPFNIATKGEPTGVAADFINFIMSADGQEIVSDGYIAINSDAEAFTSDGSEGKIVVGGSSSVSPVMEKLAEAYMELNTKATIELQESDSTTGMTSCIEGIYDIGMASRELKDDEAAQLTGLAIANDGIAVIVNLENSVEELTSEQIRQIYTGEITNWSDVAAK